MQSQFLKNEESAFDELRATLSSERTILGEPRTHLGSNQIVAKQERKVGVAKFRKV
jgi:hypothetical protein